MKILECRFRRCRFSVYDKQVEKLRTVLVGIKSGKANAQLFPLRALGKIETPAKGLFRIRLENLDVKTAVFREIFRKGQGIVTNNQTKPTVQPRGLEDGVGLDVLGRSVKPYAAQDTDEQGYDHNEGGGKKSCQGFHFLDHT